VGGDPIRESAPKASAQTNDLNDYFVTGAAARLVRIVASHPTDHNQFVIGASRLAASQPLGARCLVSTHYADRRQLRYLVGKRK
jgi:hypothetical protein